MDLKINVKCGATPLSPPPPFFFKIDYDREFDAD